MSVYQLFPFAWTFILFSSASCHHFISSFHLLLTPCLFHSIYSLFYRVPFIPISTTLTLLFSPQALHCILSFLISSTSSPSPELSGLHILLPCALFYFYPLFFLCFPPSPTQCTSCFHFCLGAHLKTCDPSWKEKKIIVKRTKSYSCILSCHHIETVIVVLKV